MDILIYYLLAVNIIGACLVVIDKKAAQKHKWRVRESTFFLFAVFGGSIGVYSFMHIFHHKTLHKRFMIGIPLIFLAELAIAIYICSKFKEALF